MNATLEQELCLWCENVSRCFDSDDRNLTYASAPSRSPTCMCTCTCLYSALPLRHAASLCRHIDKRGDAKQNQQKLLCQVNIFSCLAVVTLIIL